MPQVARMLEKMKPSEVVIDRTLSPEEAVAHGAAVYAKYADQQDSESGSNADDVTITDVNAHHLGVMGVEPETGRRIRRVMIGKNTQLPAKEAARFQTVRENQRNVLVEVIEGGDARGKHATRIGKFVIYDLPRGLPAGTPVDVYFSYDRDGIIEVEALMPTTGSKASIRIERVSGMSSEEREGWRDRARELLEVLGLD
jgi:molecular chaperone DnaK